jgi:hypothetical protein
MSLHVVGNQFIDSAVPARVPAYFWLFMLEYMSTANWLVIFNINFVYIKYIYY